ncbi:hypothetical protein BOTBODRAFT_169072 [Botryobasidium botryosum FD-172 SS1]|uniref:Aminopeptidase P N-terminal domain-containing protein n=1 Tax=Botryobasidium botryosum (strain FD-172 SS1) TaxID=930990 RepID=A0A067N4L4_BOTB1|nr:hypothetical protein BOTBODRAFT_169072 [Botryobasidium botryosum FD-172 SS1]
MATASTTSIYPAREHISKTVSYLVQQLKDEDRSKTHLVYLASTPVTFRDDTDSERLFRQESHFFYLTGCDVQSSGVLISIDATSGDPKVHTTLLIPKEDPLETLWSLPPPTLQEAAHTHEADAFNYTSSLIPTLDKLLSSGTSSAVLHVLPAKLFPPLPTELLESKYASLATSEYLLPALHKARLIKTPYEIELMRTANGISSRAHEVVMRLLGRDAAGVGADSVSAGGVVMPAQWRIEAEAEAEAVFVASCRREGSRHQAYLPIVASAQRAATLHMCCNDREFAWGPVARHQSGFEHHHHGHNENGANKQFVPQVLLIDAGCEWRNYASDITRVTPVGNGGKFTKEAREIYSLVLKMQKEAIASLKPSIHWDSVHYQCHVTLVRGFIALGIFVDDEQAVLDSQISAAFFPHGVGHSIGLDTHDVPSVSKPKDNPTIPELSSRHPLFYTYLRLRLPLQAGMALTAEPGIYFSPHQLAPVRNSPYINHEVLARYESVGGVRIEDVLVITETGSKNLTTVGKDVEWVEKVSSGEI